MSNDSDSDGCGGCIIFIIFILAAVMCSRQAKELGYRDKEIIQLEIIDIRDTIIYLE